MIIDSRLFLNALAIFVFHSFNILVAPCIAQEGDTDPEIQAVFRITKHFLNDVVDEKIIAEIPLSAKVMGFCCTGTIRAQGQIAVELQNGMTQDKLNSSLAIFSVNSVGDGSVCVRGRRGPIVAYGSAWGPFTSRTLIEFDGRHFRHLRTEPDVTVHANLQRVTGHRDRPIGRLIGAGVRPMANRRMPRAIGEATTVANRYLSNYIAELADQIIVQLNQETPIEQTFNRLFPKTSHWGIQISTEADFIQSAYGPAEAEVPNLPEAPNEIPGVRMEVWLHSTSEEAQFLAAASQQPLAKQLVQKYLESSLPELVAVADEISVDAVGPWVLIRVGKGATPEIHIDDLHIIGG